VFEQKNLVLPAKSSFNDFAVKKFQLCGRDRNSKSQITTIKWFDKLTTLSLVR